MKFRRHTLACTALLVFSASLTSADEQSVNPKVVKVVNEVSEARIRAIIEKLVSFGTRNTIGIDGSESIVTPYAYPPRTRMEIETVAQ